MRGKKAKAVRRAARQMASGPTMWRRISQAHRLGRKLDSQIIVTPGTFRDCVKQFKRDCVLLEE